jgi:hypothetical protein
MQFLCQRLLHGKHRLLHHLVIYFAPRLKQIRRKNAFWRANAKNQKALFWCHFAPIWFLLIFAPIQGQS